MSFEDLTAGGARSRPKYWESGGREALLEATTRIRQTAYRFARAQPLAAISAIFLVFLAFMAVTAPFLAPHDPLGIAPLERLQGSSLSHPLGTDHLGRDMFSRIVHGARISLTVGFFAVLLGTGVGSLVGLVTGYYGGKVDLFAQRIIDAMQAFPGLLLALALISVLGASPRNVIIAVAFSVAPRDARIVRGVVLQAKAMDYIHAARSVGAADWRLMLRHILPNVTAPIVIMASVTFAGAILTEASLSFLGLGTPPPAPSWGGMLSGEGRQYLETNPLLAIYPGLAITFAVLALNLLGDGLRDMVDPRLRGRR